MRLKFLKEVRGRAAFALLAGFLATIAGSGRAGTISGSFSDLARGTAVDLTAHGPADWVHWGLLTERSINRKALVPPQISDYALLIGGDAYAQAFRYEDNWNGYSWGDGSPAPSATNTTTGLWAYSDPVALGTGFEIGAPADTRPRVLRVYVGVYSGKGELTATLSDNSAPPYLESSLSHNGNGVSRVYVLNYTANSAGQNLRVSWRLKQKQGGTANVTLQAAALATPGINIPPGISLTSPSNTAQFPIGQPIAIEANVGDRDGSVTRVAFFKDGSNIGESANSPHGITWVGAPAGLHRLTAVATDDAGESFTSAPVEVVVYGTGGRLSGSVTSPPPPSVNLTAEGTLDWVHWGLTSSSSVDRNADVLPLISNVSHVGTNAVERLTDSAAAWHWVNGNLTLNNAGSRSGISVTGRGQRLELVIPATSRPRMLKIYAGLYGAQIGFRAWLSDFSAPAYYASLTSAYNTRDGVLAVLFASVSPDNTLILQLESQVLFDTLFGNLRLMSATLQVDDSMVLPVRLMDPMRLGDDFVFSFETQSNHTYSVARLDAWATAPWTTLTNLVGNGSKTTFTNPITSGAHFYRVTEQ